MNSMGNLSIKTAHTKQEGEVSILWNQINKTFGQWVQICKFHPGQNFLSFLFWFNQNCISINHESCSFGEQTP